MPNAKVVAALIKRAEPQVAGTDYSLKEAREVDKSVYVAKEAGEYFVFGESSGFAYSNHDNKAEAEAAARSWKPQGSKP